MHLKRTGKIIIGCFYSLIYKSPKMMSLFETLDYILKNKCSIRNMNGSVPAQGSESPLKANIFLKCKTAPILTVSRIKDSLTKSLQKYFKISVQVISCTLFFYLFGTGHSQFTSIVSSPITSMSLHGITISSLFPKTPIIFPLP